MNLKTVVVSIACIVSSTVLFPLFAIGGCAVLFLVAAGTELLHLLTGTAGQGIDHSGAAAHSRFAR